MGLFDDLTKQLGGAGDGQLGGLLKGLGR